MLSSPGVSEVPVEATAFLGAVAAFVVFLFVLFLYLNKKLCFYTVGNFPCCDDTLAKPDKLKQLGAAYNYGDGDSSSDSEEEITNRLSTSKSFPSALRDNGHHHHHHANHAHHNHPTHNHAHVTYSTHAPTYHSYNNYNHHNYHQLGPSRSSSQYSAPDEAVSAGRGDGCPCDTTSDLISLAEKGRAGVGGGGGGGGEEDPVGVGVGVSSSSASSSGSTTSGDDDLLTHRALRHRDPRAYRQMSPNRSPYDEGYQPGEDGLAGEALLARCGSIEAGFAYDLPTKTLTVHVLQAKDLPTKERGGAANTQVRVLLLPGRKQKHKTRIRPGENPQFNEAFVFTKVNPEDVQQLGVRLRLYGCERMRREKMVGEVIMPFASINLTQGNTFWLTLEPRANLARSESRSEVCSLTRSDSTGSTHSVHSGVPELLVGLTYNGTTGRLAVEVIKGSHFRNSDDFRNMANTRAPDTYVKLVLMSSSGQEIAHSKTSVRRGQPSPLFKETFMFQVALFQLPDVTLMVSVYTKRSMKRKDMIGWFALGLNSSGEEELAHWNQMRDSKGEQVCRWHVLLES
ncbi:synaptotagmin-14 isoform X1 [Palaemon carinicauda]|uniref:synaptotagmin-14 isoform X1 n=1 Tax=Palaemon carinicauda TaxID=392227 RepID=UPI0035B68F41